MAESVYKIISWWARAPTRGRTATAAVGKDLAVAAGPAHRQVVQLDLSSTGGCGLPGGSSLVQVRRGRRLGVYSFVELVGTSDQSGAGGLRRRGAGRSDPATAPGGSWLDMDIRTGRGARLPAGSSFKYETAGLGSAADTGPRPPGVGAVGPSEGGAGPPPRRRTAPPGPAGWPARPRSQSGRCTARCGGCGSRAWSTSPPRGRPSSPPTTSRSSTRWRSSWPSAGRSASWARPSTSTAGRPGASYPRWA
jgi:hypothetical protein